MAVVQHKDITDPNIHEPKGIVDADSGELYIANGSGGGTWGKLGVTSLTVPTEDDAFLITDGSGSVKVSKVLFTVSFSSGVQVEVQPRTTSLRIFSVPGLNPTTDTILSVAKSNHQTGLIMGHGFLSASGTLNIQYVNVTDNPITPTAAETLTVFVKRSE